MLWDPGSVEKDEEAGGDNTPVTPILVPLQKTPSTVEKSVPVLVPDVQDLKDQFQQQQNMLTQIKETLIQNESQLSSKGKQVEVYANKLSQIRARSKNTQARKSTGGIHPNSPKMQKKLSKENLVKLDTSEGEKSSGNNSKNRKGKVSELKKCLEENKIKFEERTGKEQSEAKKIETLVEHLKLQLEERDKTILDLQKTIEEPTPKPESIPKPKAAKPKESVASKTTQTTQSQPTEDSIEVIALQTKIHQLEANVLDLEENLKEKESVISARTQAVTLLSQDLSLKGKNTLESLEETRQEMRTMQNNFIAMEDQLKKDLVDRDSRLQALDEKCRKLESTNFELSLKNAEQQEKLVNLQAKYLEADAERTSLKESTVQGQPDDKLDELTKKINVLTKELDDRNKSMIKMKIEHKNKLKNLNKTVDILKGASDEKAEIVRLRSLMEEFENVKTGLENRVAELEDEKASEKKLKDQINELEIIIKKQNEDLVLHLKTITSLEKDNFDLVQSNQDKNILIENLQARVLAMEPIGEGDDEQIRLREMSQRLENMEAEYKRKMEELRGEHRKEIEVLESYYYAKGDSLDRRALEEYRISSEMNNIHVEEQIELLIREKQQLLEKLKSLSGVSSTDSLTFEKMEHSDLRDGRDASFPLGEEVDLTAHPSQINRTFHLEKIVNDQQHQINDLQKAITDEKEKVETYQKRISELEGTIKELESVNTAFKQQIEISEAAESGRSTKTNTNTKNRIKKIEMELTQSKKTIQEQSEKLKELSLKLQEKEELIQKYTEKIELFEKDDWDRQNHWKNTEDDIENMQELQKKCLSLENSLFELNEDCERLRKENIEVVHLLSEEKVKRRKLLEQLETKPEVRDAETQNGKDIEERIKAMNQVIRELEEKIERIESNHMNQGQEEIPPSRQQWEVADLQEKLEWTNVVLTSKETEIFRLQNLLEDRNSLVEVLEMDLKESRRQLEERDKRLGEIMEELKAKEIQMGEISANFDKLQESLEVANQKTATNETQLKELLATVKEMEGDVFKKEAELQEIKGILAEKNLDMTNLRNRLEEVNSDLTYSYQEHLENMGKCLRDKESDYDVLQSEKNHLEEVNRNLVKEKEDIHNEKVEISSEKDKLKNILLEKEKLIAELTEKLEATKKAEEKPKSQEMEDMKIKMKKLAANLKKKAQNEADLTKQVKELEGFLSEREKRAEGLESEVKEATEKWEREKSEKEKMAIELSSVLAEKVALEKEKAALMDRVTGLEKELEAFRIAHETQMKELGGQNQMLQEACRRLQMVEQEDKGKIAHLEAKTAELCQLYENATSVGVQNQHEVEKERGTLLQNLAETTGKYEELKFNHEQTLLKNSETEKRLEEIQKTYEESLSEVSSLHAKIQENLAVIEGLETELKRTRDQMKVVEEKLFHSEDRRLSLENKNEEMCKKIMENSENLITIDDLSFRVDDLVKSEKFLQDCVKSLESNNAELKQALDQIQTEKFSLEKELKVSSDKMAEIGGELKQMKNSEGDKTNLIRELSMEVERLRAENKQIMSEFDKLNQDYEQFEVDFKENLENSQNLEKSLKHKIEELLSENASLSEKCNLLSEDKHHDGKPEAEEEKKPKKRKSVTFRTDEVEYIKDLKTQLHAYDANLKKATEEIESLKGELLRERLRQEVSVVVTEAQVKVESLRSTPEKTEEVAEPVVVRMQKAVVAGSPEERKFDANAFFGNDGDDPFLEVGKPADPQQSSEFDSLMWDDGWGTEGHLEAEYLSTKVIESEKGNETELKIKALETEVNSLREENERLTKELQEQTAKYAKALKKLKEVKVAHDKLQVEVNKLKSSSGFGDLDAAIVDELKSQIEGMEAKEKELLRNLDNSKLEKENLLKRIDVLNSGNEKFLEMKERQDNEVEIWQRKNNELLKEIAELRQQVENPKLPDDDNTLTKEVQELRNKVEALEWKNCELNELLEEKQELLEGQQTGQQNSDVEKVMKEKSQLQKEIEELNNVRELLEKKLCDEEKKNTVAIGELNEQLTALASENETLQDILGEMKKTADAAKKEEKQDSKIFDYFKSSSGDDLFPVGAPPKEPDNGKPEQLSKEVDMLTQKITQMEGLIQQKEEQLKESCKEVESLRQALSDAENAIRLRDEQLNLFKIQKESEVRVQENQEMSKEVEGLRQKLSEAENVLRAQNEQLQQLRMEKENEVFCMRQTITELENLIRLRDAENAQIQQTTAAERENLLQRLQELENTTKVKDQFETIDLNQTASSFPDDEGGILRQRILDLESLVSQRDEELDQVFQTKTNEVENLRQKVFQLEDTVRLGEEEINRLQTSEVELLRRKIQELEEFARFKENELYQVQSVKESEVQNLNQRIFELENMLKGGPDQQRMFDLENMLRFKEEETRQKSVEVETLAQRLTELEKEIPKKDEEIGHLVVRLNELEKSYNDSKLEIERLLNEEKLNVEEKFVEPFQENMKIPVAFEVEALNRALDEEKQKSENLQYELSERENLLAVKNSEVEKLNSRLAEVSEKLKDFQEEDTRRSVLTEESYQVKAQLEKMISDLQKELENSNLQLSVARRELEEFQNMKDDAMANLKSQLYELETELMETREREQMEVAELRKELAEKTKYYEGMVKERREEEEKTKELVRELERGKAALEKEVEALRVELGNRERDVEALAQALEEERKRVEEMTGVLQGKEEEVADLKETLAHLQEEIRQFRNFEKQVKELRVAQMKETGADVPVTPEGHPDLSDWTEHELAELSARLQSDLDTALYMLHQRDVRCDELTFELMQLLEERDTLQLRLSTALRINEELRALSKPGTTSSGQSLQESKDLVDQSNDRQGNANPLPGENLQDLANKISELHSVSYLRDKTVKDDSMQRHKEQMNLLSRVSDSDITLSRDVQSSPAVFLNWMRGKTTPKVMHI